MQPMLESAVQEMNDRFSSLLDNERRMCRAALTEQRSQFCYFVSWFKPVLVRLPRLLYFTGRLLFAIKYRAIGSGVPLVERMGDDRSRTRGYIILEAGLKQGRGLVRVEWWWW